MDIDIFVIYLNFSPTFCCQVARALRTACGSTGNITKSECFSYGCCWDPTHDELVPQHCYQHSGKLKKSLINLIISFFHFTLEHRMEQHVNDLENLIGQMLRLVNFSGNLSPFVSRWKIGKIYLLLLSIIFSASVMIYLQLVHLISRQMKLPMLHTKVNVLVRNPRIEIKRIRDGFFSSFSVRGLIWLALWKGGQIKQQLWK